MLQEGKPAPKFELQDDRDETVKLGDYKGRTFVLYFFPRADTPG
jgi:peroxiredoxin Q/BCP